MQSSTAGRTTVWSRSIKLVNGMLFKIGLGVAVLGGLIVGPAMSERDRFLRSVSEAQLQSYKGLTSGWPQEQSRRFR